MSETPEKNPEPELKYEDPLDRIPGLGRNEVPRVTKGPAYHDVKKFVRAKPSFWQVFCQAASHSWSHFIGDLGFGKCKNNHKDGSAS